MKLFGWLQNILPRCFSCKASTKYVCITCRKPVCNREGCSYEALQKTEGWKAFQSVSRCGVCYSKSKTSFEDCPEQSLPINSGGPSTSEPSRAKEKRISIKQDGNRGVKRKFLTLKEKIEYSNKFHLKESVIVVNYNKNVIARRQ